MGLNKFSLRADGIADLYRAALYMGRGADKISLQFLSQAKRKLGRLSLPKISLGELKNHQCRIFWAEKILDQYYKLKHQSMNK
jgi:hypothetical protein